MAGKKKKKPVDAKGNEHATAVRNTRLLVVLLCIALSALAVVPFFFMGSSDDGDLGLTLRMPATHDMFLQYDQMKSFYNGLAAGKIYPRWEEDTNRGFGAATTSYYPPGIYYLTSALYALTRDWLRALLDAHLLMMIASAAALYVYAREVMSRRASLVAMAAYIFFPYHIADQYQRGALAELLGFVWMPLILLFGERLMEQDSTRQFPGKLVCTAWLALSYGGFLWSHPPTAYQFTMGFGVYVAVRAMMTRKWKGLIWVGAGMAVGLGLSAAYILPAFVEQDLIHREFIADIWPYHKTYIFVHDLYGTDLHRGFFHSLDAMWIFGTVVIVVAAVLVKFKLPPSIVGTEMRRRATLWIVLGSFASLMMLKLSQPLGMLIPKIDIGVFTWRMLSITTLVTALLAGACAQVAIEAGKEHLNRERRVFGSLALVVLIGAIVFSTGLAARQVSAPVFVPESEHFNSATLPRTAPAEPGALPADAPQAALADESGTVVVKRWAPEHRRMYVDSQAEDRLLIRTFNFPGWTATIDGQRVEIITGEMGEICIDLQPGAHEVSLEFLDTPVRRSARQITLWSFGLLLGLLFAPLASRAIRAGRTSD
jgi:dolichyl-phosphate-mannose-protein mannosyltransferase